MISPENISTVVRAPLELTVTGDHLLNDRLGSHLGLSLPGPVAVSTDIAKIQGQRKTEKVKEFLPSGTAESLQEAF